MNASAAAPTLDPPPRQPLGFRLSTLGEQITGLLVVGIALTLAARGAWATGLLEARLPQVVLPWVGLEVPLARMVPFLVSVLLGLLPVLSGARSLLVLWVGLVVLMALGMVVESDRLNWFAFFSGFSVRLVEGPVPLRRTFFALIALLGAYWVLAQDSVHRYLVSLAGRGVAASELRMLRRRLLAHERGVLALALAGGTVLLVVMRLSMMLSETAPEARTGAFGPFLFVLLLVSALVGLMGYLAIRGKLPDSDGRSDPPGR